MFLSRLFLLRSEVFELWGRVKCKQQLSTVAMKQNPVLQIIMGGIHDSISYNCGLFFHTWSLYFKMFWYIRRRKDLERCKKEWKIMGGIGKVLGFDCSLSPLGQEVKTIN